MPGFPGLLELPELRKLSSQAWPYEEEGEVGPQRTAATASRGEVAESRSPSPPEEDEEEVEPPPIGAHFSAVGAQPQRPKSALSKFRSKAAHKWKSALHKATRASLPLLP
eukprot:CAMPEP_0180512784 /NCGR_PEP_ID=MMETSP1036_2-20121128/51783_1 /TAXON_ID=632150 /ORGANISM="Azadinium spinosum, Strain 3D9" /LENGTH=109 /DNA_ID=CAMNT_0022523967 /DNA_START=54 /DNA_END=380 /DNA_ORIENTATION=+